MGVRTAEGDISLWVRKAVKNSFREVKFVDDKKNAELIIETQKVELINTTGCKFLHSCNKFYNIINNKPILFHIFKPLNYTFADWLIPFYASAKRIVKEDDFINSLTGYEKLLTLTLKEINNPHVINISEFPSKITADMVMEDNVYKGLINITKAEE